MQEKSLYRYNKGGGRIVAKRDLKKGFRGEKELTRGRVYPVL